MPAPLALASSGVTTKYDVEADEVGVYLRPGHSMLFDHPRTIEGRNRVLRSADVLSLCGHVFVFIPTYPSLRPPCCRQTFYYILILHSRQSILQDHHIL